MRTWWGLVVAAGTMPCWGQVEAVVELPDAPGATRAAEPSAASAVTATGQVTDKKGNGIAGAEVTLLSGSGSGADGAGGVPGRQAVTDAEGVFLLRGVPAGHHRLQVAAQGFREEMVEVEVRATREREELPTVVLQLAATTADVEVTVTTEQIAQEQMHDELQQRALGVFPNFYTSFLWGAAPLNARQKFTMATHAKLDPISLATTVAAAGLETGANRFKGYGDGAAGFGKRFGAEFATSTAGRFLGSAVFPALFHQDPRYFWNGRGGVGSRALYAATRCVVTRSDAGTWQPNYSRVLGHFASAALANAYLPASDRTLHVTLSTAGLGVVAEAGGDLIREFVLRRLTTKVPGYAGGRPPEETEVFPGRDKKRPATER